MTQLQDRMREVPVPSSTSARERTVADARAELAARSHRSAHSAVPRRLVALSAAALLAAAIVLTPPGRAASAWVGKLVGIGEVGGAPTQHTRSFDTRGTAVVVDNGRAPDGSRYEWVAYECHVDLRDEGLSTNIKGIGLSLEWPDVKGREGGGSCGERVGGGNPAFASHGMHIVPTQFEGFAEPDLVLSGSTGPDVHRVRVRYTDGKGNTRELPVEFARVDGRLRDLASRDQPLGTFVAFIPGAVAAEDELESRLDLRALQGTDASSLGPIARAERAGAVRAHAACEHLQPEPSADRDAIERASLRVKGCLDARMPVSPIEYVAYDAQGREVGRSSEPLASTMLPRSEQSDRIAGREAADAKRAERPPNGEATGEPAVLMSARAPDGALHEVYLERLDRGRACVMHWWPFVPMAGAGGSCGPAFPPVGAFRSPDAKPVAARPFGFLEEAAPATRHRVISGYAKPDVTRVRVVYGDGRDAPVELSRAAAPGSDAGFWLAFVPPVAGKQPTLDVIAYDGDRELSRFRVRD